MKDMLWSFFLEHGWKLTLLALSGIPFLGILKRTHMFDKIENKNTRKALFEGISSGFAILMSLIYLLAVGKFEIDAFMILTGGILLLNQGVYALYENYGVRWLVNKGIDVVWDFIKRLFTKKLTDQESDSSSEEVDIIDDLSDKKE